MAVLVGLGVYWLARLMVAQGHPAAPGLLLLAVPAIPIAVDSMTIDALLVVLTAWFAFQRWTGRTGGLWWVLAAAAGALLERAPRKAFLCASSTILPSCGTPTSIASFRLRR